MNTRPLGMLLIAVGVMTAAYCFGRIIDGGRPKPMPTAQPKELTNQAGTNATNAEATIRPLAPPPFSGIQVHAFQLWQSPNRYLGKLIALDGKSIPTLGPNGVDSYSAYDKHYAILSQEIGLRFRRKIAENVCLFDLAAHPWEGFGADHVPDATVIGQIAVEMNGPELLPDQFQIWDVEPKGTIEATTERGFVIRIPLVHFWRYQESGKDAEAPPVTVIPPQHPAS